MSVVVGSGAVGWVWGGTWHNTDGCGGVSQRAGDRSKRAGVVRTYGRTAVGSVGRPDLLLCLVADEVDFRLGGRGGRSGRDDDRGRVRGVFVQHVYQSLLLILLWRGEDRGGRGRVGRCLDEDYLVVLLGRRRCDDLWGCADLGLGRWQVYVDVLLDHRLLLLEAVVPTSA